MISWDANAKRKPVIEPSLPPVYSVQSKPDSLPTEGENRIIVQTTSQNAAMDICLISTRLSSSTVKETIFLCETEEGVGAEEYN